MYADLQPSDRTGALRKSSFQFLKRLASTLNIANIQSQKESVLKSARQEIEGFTQLMKMFISSVKNANPPAKEILDTLSLLSWYIHRLWKRLVRHIFPAKKTNPHIPETYPHLMDKLQETLQYIFDSNWFPEGIITITKLPLENYTKIKN